MEYHRFYHAWTKRTIADMDRNAECSANKRTMNTMMFAVEKRLNNGRVVGETPKMKLSTDGQYKSLVLRNGLVLSTVLYECDDHVMWRLAYAYVVRNGVVYYVQ